MGGMNVRAIAVDDEPLALVQMKKMLEATQAFSSIRTCQDPLEALDEVKKQAADVVFLDIEMPEVDGIELAETIQSIDERIEIVFVTAYNEFAVKAFELNAVDYLLKPVEQARLEKTLQRLASLHTSEESPESGQVHESGEIECFGSLRFSRFVDGQRQDIPVKWRTSKARELYAYLLQNHDQIVGKESLIDRFWPEADFSRANAQLYSTIYQMRKVIGSLPFHQKIIKKDVGYMLTLSDTPVDAIKWERRLKALPPLGRKTLNAHVHVFSAYKSHYLNEYDYIWAEPEKTRLRQLWLAHACSLIDYLMGASKFAEAMDIARKADQIDPGHEKIIKYILHLANKTGDVEGAIKEYERYKMMKDELK